MVTEAKERETAVNTVERHPPTKANPFANVRFRQFAAETGAADPFQSIFVGFRGGIWGRFGGGDTESFGRGSGSRNG